MLPLFPIFPTSPLHYSYGTYENLRLQERLARRSRFGEKADKFFSFGNTTCYYFSLLFSYMSSLTYHYCSARNKYLPHLPIVTKAEEIKAQEMLASKSILFAIYAKSNENRLEAIDTNT